MPMKLAPLFALLTSVSLHAAPALILHHGKVITVDKSFRIAEAIAINADGRIAAVGSNDEILALKNESTQQIDLAGKTVLPGLMDSHVHPGAAMIEFDHEIPTMETIADVLAYVSDRVKVSKPGDLISVRQIPSCFPPARIRCSTALPSSSVVTAATTKWPKAARA